MRESKIEAHLVDEVAARGGEVRKVKWIGRRGAPDRVVMFPGGGIRGLSQERQEAATVWVELKAPGKKPDPHQAREHERMRRMGQTVLVIDSIEGVDALLRSVCGS
jgi:hypothetical protein